MIVTHKLSMDLMQPGMEQRIYAVQDDKYSRNLEVRLFSGGAAWALPADANILIGYRKSDGTGGEYDTLPDGTGAYAVEGNILTVALAPQVLTVPGIVFMAVTVIQGTQEISTFAVHIVVRKKVEADVGKSEDYVNVTGLLRAPTSGKIGQYLRISEVDEHGQVRRLEAADVTGGNGDTNGAISAHNVSQDAHNDIRLLVQGLTTRLNALANSDDTTLDQMAEVVAYIKDNRELIEQITTGKVSTADIIDNLTTSDANKPLSAKQGVALKALIDALPQKNQGNTVYVTINLDDDGVIGTSSHSSQEIMALVQSGVDVRCIYDEFVLLPLYIAAEDLVMLGAFLPGFFFNVNGGSLREDLIYAAGYMIIGDRAQYIEIPYEYPVATSENMGVVRADPAEATDTQPVRIGEDGMLYTAAGAADTEQIGWQHITTITAESADIISYEITAEEYPFLAECNEIVVVFKKAENTSTPYIKFSANDSRPIQNSAGNMGFCMMRASMKGSMVRLGMSGFSNISLAPTMNDITDRTSSIAYNYVDRLTSYDHFEKIKVESYTKFIDVGGTIAFYGWKA